MTTEQKKEFTRKISQANSSELIVILYDIALVYVDESIRYMEKEDFTNAGIQAGFAKRSVEEMIANLHFEYDLAVVLHRIYLSMKKSLREAMLKNDKQPLIAVKRDLLSLRDAYAQIVTQDKSAPVMGHAQTVVAGLTYGRNALNESLAQESSNRGFCV